MFFLSKNRTSKPVELEWTTSADPHTSVCVTGPRLHSYATFTTSSLPTMYTSHLTRKIMRRDIKSALFTYAPCTKESLSTNTSITTHHDVHTTRQQIPSLLPTADLVKAQLNTPKSDDLRNGQFLYPHDSDGDNNLPAQNLKQAVLHRHQGKMTNAESSGFQNPVSFLIWLMADSTASTSSKRAKTTGNQTDDMDHNLDLEMLDAATMDAQQRKYKDFTAEQIAEMFGKSPGYSPQDPDDVLKLKDQASSGTTNAQTPPKPGRPERLSTLDS